MVEDNENYYNVRYFNRDEILHTYRTGCHFDL